MSHVRCHFGALDPITGTPVLASCVVASVKQRSAPLPDGAMPTMSSLCGAVSENWASMACAGHSSPWRHPWRVQVKHLLSPSRHGPRWLYHCGRRVSKRPFSGPHSPAPSLCSSSPRVALHHVVQLMAAAPRERVADFLHLPFGRKVLGGRPPPSRRHFAHCSSRTERTSSASRKTRARAGAVESLQGDGIT